MYICLNCNYKTEAPAKFCPNCGQPMAEVRRERPAEMRPVYTPVVAAPAYTGRTEVSLGKKITGMALGIAGLVCAVMSVLYGILGALYEEIKYGYSYNYYSAINEFSEMMYAFAIVFGIIGLVLSIVGVSISSSSGADGRKLGLSKAGKICGIIGIVLSAVFVFICLVNL